MIFNFGILKNYKKNLFIFLASFFVVTYSISLWMAFYVPIYSDEIQWKLIASRIFLDGGKLLYFFPACESGFLLDTPLSALPARWIDSLIYSGANNFQLIRWIGCFQFLVLSVLWTWMLHVNSKLSLKISFLIVSSFFVVGVLPFLMVLNRPEQSLLIWLSLGLSISIALKKITIKSFSLRIFLTFFVVLLASLIAGAHPKGLYFLPVLVFAYWNILRSIVLNIIVIGSISYISLQTIRLWELRTSCIETPWLTKIFASLTLKPQQLLESPNTFFNLGFTNIKNGYAYITTIAFQESYQSSWLPSMSIDAGVIFINILNSAPLFLIGTIILKNWIDPLFDRNKNWNGISFLLALALLVLIFMQSNKNFYEASIFWPSFLLIFINSFSVENTYKNKFLKSIILPLMLIVAITTSYIRYDLFFDFAKEWKNSNNAIKNNSSYEVKDFARSNCGISDGTQSLIMSDGLYPLYWNHPRPIFTAFLFGWWATGSDYHQTLKKYKLDGMIAVCSELPQDLQKASNKNSKGYCCMSKEKLNNFFDNTQ